MGSVFEGWNGAGLHKKEVTAGTAVVPDTSFGYLQSISPTGDSGLEAIHAIGSPYPQDLEEGIIEAGGSLTVLPVDDTVFKLLTRNGSGILDSYTVHSALGTKGISQTGCKFNQLRGEVQAGSQKGLQVTLDWFCLAPADQNAIAAVIPTAEIFTWREIVHSLPGEVSQVGFSINQNLRRVPAMAGSGTTIPVTGIKRAPYRITEGTQGPVDISLRFFDRPTQDVITDVLASIATFTLICTGTSDSPVPSLTLTFSNGKPKSRAPQVSVDQTGLWTLGLWFRTWAAAYATTP